MAEVVTRKRWEGKCPNCGTKEVTIEMDEEIPDDGSDIIGECECDECEATWRIVVPHPFWYIDDLVTDDDDDDDDEEEDDDDGEK